VCRRGFSTPQEFQLADPVQIRGFQSLVRNPLAESLDLVTDSELMLRVGSRADSNPKFATLVERTLNSQQITQVGVTSFIEGTSQPDAGLDRGDGS
jgi:hypothetical protein